MAAKHTASVALAGNPNAGKTTLFNALTGARQHVGNYPGITVERKEGVAVVDGREVRILDLPGTYSLSAYSPEELVARNVLVSERPQVVVGVLNAACLERNLYLAVQLMELGAPLMLALNMMDEAEAQGMRINMPRLAELLGVPVLPLVAKRGKGVRELMALVTARLDAPVQATPLHVSYGPDLDVALTGMQRLIEQHHFLTDRYPARWIALKYLEEDAEVLAQGRQAGAVSAQLEEIAAKTATHCRNTLEVEPEAIIADYRYGFIASLMRKGVLSREVAEERRAFSEKVDRVLTQRMLGPVLMFGILLGLYHAVFTLGETPMGWMEMVFGWLSETASGVLPEGALRSLIVSGIIEGVGGVFSFVPLIMIMFFLLAFLEDTGYMARVAYMLDRVFRIFGLHGSSVMPLIISGGVGGGCAVPGVMAARTLRSPKERLATILTAPFMTCGAKLPVFILVTGVVLPDHQAWGMFALTLAGWAMALVGARVLRWTVIRGPATPFVMELPPYRFPTMRGLLIHTWERTWQYIKKAGTVILAISILIWAAMTYPSLPEEQAAALPDEAAIAEASLEYSVAGRIGKALEPLSSLAGFDWRTNIALVGGFAAKEVIVSTLGTAYSLGEVDAEDASSLSERLAANPNFTMAAAIALMLFVLIYAPCFVTVVTIWRESNWKWALFSTAYSTVTAYVLAVAVFQGLSRIL
ncbi:ferrous iron transport protein B [Megalodesulfovibrio gigas]|uniref:Ferrous iron transport protein B n=1 Tax=Megalodesulfovibrio gigas (strain ATCC 19364 / DSM 1382 / NCIMB 9332 / VKM B-1759) TaxID=1121448 RepID=T2GB97_MEGG1|nr:ferrous iron transport protein B [Megalodesulfovibrio gigas]AGW13172.1 putative ferrous iron transport protein B [Megalodesulfovibrio gigas DSM 1382 = ATCC 19364]